jgi:cytidylate kinase
MIIAIDGPAGSGKSSTAKAVAAALGSRHLDSGALYRAITWAALETGLPVREWVQLDARTLNTFDVRSIPAQDRFDVAVRGQIVGDEIRGPEVNAHVSRMAAIPAVREWLLGALREAGRSGQLVADGRDIGTVVFPDADLKLFLVCAPEERARRRLRERGNTDDAPDEVQQEAARLQGRDALDSGRTVAPLVPAPDAIIIDTTDLTFQEQVDTIVALASSAGA